MKNSITLTVIVVLLGLFVFGQALGVASAQTEPAQPIIILGTPDSPSAGTRPEQTSPLATPIDKDSALLPTPISSVNFIQDAHLQPVDSGFLITWNTAQPSTGWVIYGNAPDALDSHAPAADAPLASTTAHSITLPALAPDAPLYFAIVVDGVRQDVDGWPFKVYAGDIGRSLVIGPATDSDAVPPDAGRTDESAAPGLGNTAPRAANATNRIGIETGHWGYDSGSPSCDGVYYERDNTYAVANLAANILRARGYTVDVIPARNNLLNGYVADAFIALHNDYCAANASGFKAARRGGTNGWGANGSGDASDRLVNAVWEHYNRVTGIAKHPGSITGDMTDYYALNMIHSSTPGVILEMGFWSGDRDMLLNRRDVLAAGVAESILAFLGAGGSDPDDNRTLTNGQTLNGTISPNNDEDVYFFDATANSRVTIRMNTTSGSLDTYLNLYSPSGTRITYDDDAGDGTNSLIENFTLSAGGRYKIVAHSWQRGSSGGYSLSLSLNSSTTSCPDNQFKAEYFSNRSLSGNPVYVRCENSPLTHNWGNGSPHSSVPVDNFSARWTGRFNFPGGNTRFIMVGDDGIRLSVDGQGVLTDGWVEQAPREYRRERNLSAGWHTVQFEFFEAGGGATAQLRWEQVTSSCTPNADQVALFVDGGYQGQCVLRGIGNYTNPSAIGMPNDSISSVKVGSNVRLILFEHDGYQGRSSTFTGDDSNLSDDAIGNDSVSSMKVETRPTGGPNYTPPSGYSFCSYENQRCSFSDRRDVAYGANGVFTYRYGVSGGIDCNNATFGDPLSGVYKACFTRSAPGGSSSNLALNRPASAWSQESSTYSPSKGNDGNGGTRWSSMISATLGEQRWWTDLGSSRSINRVKINWETAYAARYRILFSNDGTTWYCYCGTYYTRSSSGWAEHTFNTVSYRYVGIQMLNRASRMNNYSFFEFEAYGPTLMTGVQEAAPTEGVAPELQLLPNE